MLIKRLPKWFLRANVNNYVGLCGGYVVDKMLSGPRVIAAVKTDPIKMVPPMAFPGGNRCMIGNALVNRYSIQFTHIKSPPMVKVK